MKVPVSWLREYVPFECRPRDRRPPRDLLVRGRRASRGSASRTSTATSGSSASVACSRPSKHPNADRLQLCQVDIGESDPRQIVCGAWNFGAGATVGVALPGAVLPNGLQLEQRKVRGEVSDGMILAEDEVALGTDHAGIMVLENGIEPGTPLADVLPLTETVSTSARAQPS